MSDRTQIGIQQIRNSLPATGTGSFLGVWNSISNYGIGDIVAYNGYLYRAIAVNTGFAPDSYVQYWELYDDGVETVSRSIYVRLTGNDTTGNGDTATPFLTLARALETIKPIFSANVIVTIYMGDGTHDLGNNPISLAKFYTLIGEGKIYIRSENITTVVTSATPTSVTNYTDVLQAGSAWTDNEHVGAFLLSGSTYYPIAGNTADTLYIPNIASATISSYTIVRFGATITDTVSSSSIMTFAIPAKVGMILKLEYLNLLNCSLYDVAGAFDLQKCHIKYTSSTVNKLFLPESYAHYIALEAVAGSIVVAVGIGYLFNSSVIQNNITSSSAISLYAMGLTYVYFNNIGATKRYVIRSNSLYGDVNNAFVEMQGCVFRNHVYPIYANLANRIGASTYGFAGGTPYYANRIIDCDFLARIFYGQTYYGRSGFVGTPVIGWFTENGTTEIANYHSDLYTVHEFARADNERVLEDTVSISASAIDLDCNNKTRVFFEVTLTEDITVNNPTNFLNGTEIILAVTQDAIGGWNLSWDTFFNGSGGSISNPTGTGLKKTIYKFLAVSSTVVELTDIIFDL